MFVIICPICLQVLTEKAKSVAGVQQWPYKAVAKALEVIPRTLIQNCGANTIRTLTALRVRTIKHINDYKERRNFNKFYFNIKLQAFSILRSEKLLPIE